MGESARFEGLPRRSLHGAEVPVATTLRARLLGLALLPAGQAGAGLLIPGCASIHTFGMRFALDVCFLDADERVIRSIHRLPPRRVAGCRGARSVLEIPVAGAGRGPREDRDGEVEGGTIAPSGV